MARHERQFTFMRRAQNVDTRALKRHRLSQNVSPVCSRFVPVAITWHASRVWMRKTSEKRCYRVKQRHKQKERKETWKPTAGGSTRKAWEKKIARLINLQPTLCSPRCVSLGTPWPYGVEPQERLFDSPCPRPFLVLFFFFFFLLFCSP